MAIWDVNDSDPFEEKDEVKIELDDDQKKVIARFEKKENILVTGPAGTGKSMLLREIEKRCDDPRKFHIVASTGIAAVNVGGVTLHSWAGIGLGQSSAKTYIKKINEERMDIQVRILKTEILAVDELSMIDSTLWDLVDQVFRGVRQSDKPFGGIQIIGFGDFLQLPPVSKGRKKAKFCFDSRVWAKADFKTVMLTKIYRQSNVYFQNALLDVREGIISDLVERLFVYCSKNRIPEDVDVEPIKLCSHNDTANAINEAELQKIDSPPKSYASIDKCSDAMKEFLNKNCMAQPTLEIKVGAQVMLIYNVNVGRGLANGSMGIVTEINSSGPVVEFACGETLSVERQSWKIMRDGVVVAERTQYPLRLAWAVTIHKSQGMQFDYVMARISKCFEYGDVYTAVSRAKNFEGLFLDTSDTSKIKAHPRALSFYGLTDEEFSFHSEEENEEQNQQELGL